MAPNASSDVIVKVWTETGAPTGEGTRYRTGDGSEWRSRPDGYVESGCRVAHLTRDGRIRW